MKKGIKIFIILTLICSVIVILCNYLSVFKGEKNNKQVSVHTQIGNELPENIAAMLCFSNGHSEIAKSETFFYEKNGIEKSENQYLLGVSHVYPDEIITEKFAIPLGYKDSNEMEADFGQIVDYANFEMAEILILNDWYSENKKFIVAYIVDNELKTVEFPVKDEAYLGTCLDNNKIYTLINEKDTLLLSSIDITNNKNEVRNISYAGLVKDRTDLSGAFSFVKNDILYLGEATYDSKTDTVTSTISLLNLLNDKTHSISFENEWIYNLSCNGNEIVALFGTGKDSIGYYKNITCCIMDFKLDVISTHSIMGLPKDIDTVNFADRSQIYNGILYTIINDINLEKSHLIAYDIKNQEIVFYAELETKMENKILFDWNFYINESGNYYEIP